MSHATLLRSLLSSVTRMKRIPFFLVVMLAACQNAPQSVARGPNGHRTYFINEATQTTAFNKAASVCPRGYTLIGNPGQTKSGHYAMNVECK